ncbi:acyl-CoA dehydrogenase family protein [Sphingosinithalassobacter portus]|uniref:acyl-CoA dehydrogenase family protein n=1 Tax=Stakelama portus TaxID=2676234 RepID=UPI000D6DFFAE|nr:acyl-CoA dehydrogenase family protein [Sphingosinithalassobacter portus]
MVTLAEASAPAEAPSAETLIARSKAMIPTLKARARKCVTERNVPRESIAEMVDAGFFRVLQPKRYGGYEMHPNVFFEIQKNLAEGCMSTGWVYGVVGCHPFQLALFDDKAQQEVWGDDPDMLVSSTYQPVGKVERTEGGFYLSGTWGFSSGSVHCGWVLLGAFVPPEEEGGTVDMRTFLLPRKDYVIDEDQWHTFGLQGTGSHHIIVDRVFVPEHRTHSAAASFFGNNPGYAVNDGALYQMPWAQLFVRSVSSSAFGGARAAIDAAIDIMQSRVSTNTKKASKDDQVLQGAIAAAQAQTIEMEIALERQFDEIMDMMNRGERMTLEQRALYVYQSSTVAKRLAQLVDAMVERLGGRAIYLSSEIIQPWLDLQAARAHVANDPYNRSPDLVGVLVGQPPAFAFL